MAARHCGHESEFAYLNAADAVGHGDRHVGAVMVGTNLGKHRGGVGMRRILQRGDDPCNRGIVVTNRAHKRRDGTMCGSGHSLDVRVE